MPSDLFDHERLKVDQEALRFVAWVAPIVDELPPKVAARDQLERASTGVVFNLAEGNGKRSPLDRCRYFDIARGSGVESAACLDVLVARKKLSSEIANEGKAMLLPIVSMTAGLIAHFEQRRVEEKQAAYDVAALGAEKE